MSGNKFICLAGLLWICLSATSMDGRAQEGRDSSSAKKRGEYALYAYGGGGISFYTGHSGQPEGFSNQVNRTAFAGTFRLLWQPDHLLSVGFETGWTGFYTYSTKHDSLTGRTQISGVPLLVVFSMPLMKRVHLFAGVGGYLITSKLNYLEESSASTISLGWMASANYVYPLNKKWSIAGEIKYMNAYENEDANISVQLQLVWKICTW